jgi:mono/diheme cytochrome c family protein
VQFKFGLGAGQLLQTYTPEDFRKQPSTAKPTQMGNRITWTTLKERDPISGKTAPFEGIPLATLIESLLEQIPLEQRAGVDLVVVRDRANAEVFVPRWVVTRYPVLLALRTEGDQKKFQTVVPWTSKPHVQSEGLPIERYFVRDVAEIELTSYQARYKPLFLSRRTDPAAVRGEKIFVQNCMGCHADKAGGGASHGMPGPGVVTFVSRLLPENKARTVASGAHPTVPGYAQFKGPELRALGSYLNAFRTENPALGAGVSPQAAAAVPSP